MANEKRINNAALQRLSDGFKKLVVADFATLDAEGVSSEYAQIFEMFNKLSGMLKEVSGYSQELARGNVEMAPPRVPIIWRWALKSYTTSCCI